MPQMKECLSLYSACHLGWSLFFGLRYDIIQCFLPGKPPLGRIPFLLLDQGRGGTCGQDGHITYVILGPNGKRGDKIRSGYLTTTVSRAHAILSTENKCINWEGRRPRKTM